MRVVKLALLSVLVFSALALLLSLLVPSHIRVSRATSIQATNIEKVIGDLHTWPQWNELYTDSAHVAVQSATTDLVKTVWGLGDHHLPGNFTLTESSGTTVVQWYFDFKLKWYPWEKLGAITYDKQFGPPMERSLSRLKELLEKTP